MSEWKEYCIEDIISEISMGPFGSDIKKECYIESGFPVLNGSNLFGFKLKEDKFGYVSNEKAKQLKKCIAKRGDIVVTHRGTLGQIVYIPSDSKYEAYLISQSQFRFTCDTNKVLPQYLVYYFHSREGQHKILMNASQVGVPALARATSTFRKIPISLPPLPLQRRISSILSSLDAKIETNNALCAKLEEMASAIFRSWFVDFEPFQDGEFQETELGRIPGGWKVGTLGEIGEIVGGATPSKAKEEYYTANGIAWLTPKDLSNCNNKFTSKGAVDITKEGYNSCSAKMMPKGSVLFSSRAPIGYITIAKNDICTNQGFKSVVPSKAGTAFIYCLLKTNTKRIENMASGTTFKEVSGSLMKAVKIIIPPIELLERFESVMKPIFEQQETLETESFRLSHLRDTLLPRLMSGELTPDEIV